MPHSIGRTSAEMLRPIGGCTEAMVCFDTNHLLLESHADFIGALGDRIATIHLSDYDGRDERHWLPGRGVIDWPDLCRSAADGITGESISSRCTTAKPRAATS